MTRNLKPTQNPGIDFKYGYHELLHTSHIMTCMWEEHVLNHPVLKNNPELKAEALRIETEIAGFYQRVGKVEAAWENGKFPVTVQP